MPLPDRWVDVLFDRLRVRYGVAFTRQYGDLDAAAVKADWADVLDGVSGDAIAYALQYLPSEPLTALQFRDLCRAAPALAPAAALPPPKTPPPPEVRALADRMNGRPTNAAQQCLDNIARAVVARGAGLSHAQRHVAEHCLRMPGTTLPPALAADPRFAALIAGADASPTHENRAPRDDRQPVEGVPAAAAENAASGPIEALPGNCRQNTDATTVQMPAATAESAQGVVDE